MPTTAEYSLFGDNAYGGPAGSKLKHELPGSWKIMKLPVAPVYLDNPVTGFRAHVYHNTATKEVVIAFAGTNLADPGDLTAIGAIIAGQLPLQFDNAYALFREGYDHDEEPEASRRKSPSRDTPSAARLPSTWPLPHKVVPPRPSAPSGSCTPWENWAPCTMQVTLTRW